MTREGRPPTQTAGRTPNHTQAATTRLDGASLPKVYVRYRVRVRCRDHQLDRDALLHDAAKVPAGAHVVVQLPPNVPPDPEAARVLGQLLADAASVVFEPSVPPGCADAVIAWTVAAMGDDPFPWASADRWGESRQVIA